MHIIDILIFAAYMAGMVMVGLYFYRQNQSEEDYFVGGRNIGAWHIGLSVVATDVGGGFSIGLGGLGFTMGMSGSWMLFTGLIGAWMAAVLLIPRVFRISDKVKLFTFPQVFEYLFDSRVAVVAAVISTIGYLGFTSSQILAGAKLASATFDVISMDMALLTMGAIVVGYTVLGGLKAVIYTDTVQWIVLLGGLIFIGLPIAYTSVGGMEGIVAAAPPEMLSLSNITWQTVVNWAITIIPIWFIGMTLYQRIYASRDEKTAKKAWFIAGIFEWPIMAFLGISLGFLARVAAEQGMFAEIGISGAEGLDAETGLPLLLRLILPVGLMGLMMSAYFSAILSTADSCLMAASGNLVTDLLRTRFRWSAEKSLKYSQIATLVIGVAAVSLALYLQNVLELMLLSYAFMVSGLLVPLVCGLFFGNRNGTAALASMAAGGSLTIWLTLIDQKMPLGLDPIAYGLLASTTAFAIVHLVTTPKTKIQQ